jgi:tetratricopeptide (TPR) repeat protein
MARFDRLEIEEPAPEGDGQPAKPVVDEAHWLAQAEAERRQGHHENALRLYSRALEYDKSIIAAWVGQVRMLIHLGEFPEAELWSRKALEIFKNHPDLLAGQAQALCRLSKRGAAMAACDRALQQPGESAYRWQVRGELMVVAKETLDRHCFEKAVACDRDWLVLAEIAMILDYHNQPAKALPRYRAAIEIESESYFLWLRRADCELAANLPEAAKKSLLRCREMSPNDPDLKHRIEQLDHRPGFFGRLLGRDRK